MMKKIVLITLSIIAMISQSCNNFLDIQQKGMSIPQTVEDFDLMLNNAYNIGSISNVVMMSPEVSLPDAYLGNSNKTEVAAYKWSEHPYLKDENDGNWNDFYKRIMTANVIINAIDHAESKTLNEELRQQVKGQAYAERAKCLFGLVNLYSKPYSQKVINDLGVPIPLEANINTSLSRATIGEVYEQICSDIEVAEQIVPKSVKNTQRMRASKQSILAFKSKVYLFMNNIDSAFSAINRAFEVQNPQIANYEQYVAPMDPATEQYYKDNNMEFMIDIMKYIMNTKPYQLEDVDELLWLGSTISNFRALTTAFYSDYLLNEFGEIGINADYRYKFYACSINPMTFESLDGVRYYGLGTRTFAASTAEMYLLRAECNARKGNVEAAVADINFLRQSRCKSTVDYSTTATNKAEAIEMVKKERLLELAFTGQYWFDLRRYHAYGESIPTFRRNVAGTEYVLSPDSPRYTCAIPRYVISKNPNIIQNPR